MDFDRAFDLLLNHEGGYADRSLADDPGGKTKYGITENTARANGYTGDMRDLTVEKAKAIYRKDFWDACQCDALPDPIRYALFDAAVNSGVGQAVKWLQAAAGVKADGALGPVTKQAVNMAAPMVLRQQMIGKRLRFMTDLKNWPPNARGWSRRIAAILEM